MAKKGKLIGIGVGPGDTELLTLKAAKVLESIPVIFSPKSAKEKESIALSIVKPLLEKRDDYKKVMIVEPIFPMIENKNELEKIWNSAADLVSQYLNTGRDVAFITLGDPSIFSTYSYLQKRLVDDYEVETIPGITSFTACAAARNEALVDSIVLMKASRNSTKLELKIKNDKRDKDIYSVQNCTRENEKIVEGFSHEKPYLTTSIVKFRD